MNEKFFDKLAADVVRAVRESNLNVTVTNKDAVDYGPLISELATMREALNTLILLELT